MKDQSYKIKIPAAVVKERKIEEPVILYQWPVQEKIQYQ